MCSVGPRFSSSRLDVSDKTLRQVWRMFSKAWRKNREWGKMENFSETKIDNLYQTRGVLHHTSILNVCPDDMARGFVNINKSKAINDYSTNFMFQTQNVISIDILNRERHVSLLVQISRSDEIKTSLPGGCASNHQKAELTPSCTSFTFPLHQRFSLADRIAQKSFFFHEIQFCKTTTRLYFCFILATGILNEPSQSNK